MHRHTFKQPPVHDIVGQPNEAYPSLEAACGHVDEEAEEVCLRDADDHIPDNPIIFESVEPRPEDLLRVRV